MGTLSLNDLLGFLHLPLRRNLWPQIAMLDFGDGLLNLSAGSFDPAEGDELHQMVFSLETEATEFRIGFSEVQAERWAMAICEISKRVELLGRLQ